MSEIYISDHMPVLPLRGLAVFPAQTIHFDVGRVKSASALEAAMKQDQILLVVPQKSVLVDDPGLKDLYSIGTVVRVKQVLRSQGENLRVLVTGLHRAKLLDLTQQEPHLLGQVELAQEQEASITPRVKAMLREANANFGDYL